MQSLFTASAGYLSGKCTFRRYTLWTADSSGSEAGGSYYRLPDNIPPGFPSPLYLPMSCHRRQASGNQAVDALTDRFPVLT